VHCKHRQYNQHDGVRWCKRCGAMQRRIATIDAHEFWSRWSLPLRQRRKRPRTVRVPKRQLPFDF